MTLRRTSIPALAALLLALAWAGCGDGDDRGTTVVETTATRTVTVPATTPTAPTTPAAPPATAPQTTPAPSGPLTLHAAEQVLDERGFAPLTERDWRPDQTLKVLIGVRRGGAGDGGQQQAFFFAGDRWIGTDASAPSGRIAVVDQSDDAITLAYGLYRPGDSIESPSAGEAQVTFAWDGARLRPRQPIPPADPQAPRSRR